MYAQNKLAAAKYPFQINNFIKYYNETLSPSSQSGTLYHTETIFVYETRQYQQHFF